MNSKFENGKKGVKRTTAAPKVKGPQQKSKKGASNRSFDEEFFDPDLFDEKPKSKKRSGKEMQTIEDDIFFDDDLGGMDFLDGDSYYEDDDDLY